MHQLMKFPFSCISLFGMALTANLLIAGNMAIAEEDEQTVLMSFSDLDVDRNDRLNHDEVVSDSGIANHFEGADRDWNGELNAAEYSTLKGAMQKNQLDLLPDDSTLSAQVQDKLTRTLKTRHIRVETYKGEVFLTGYVDTESQSVKAIELVRTVAGVAAVKNGLIAKG